MNTKTLIAGILDMDDLTLLKEFYIGHRAEEIAHEVAGDDADTTVWWQAFENAHIDAGFEWSSVYEHIPIEDLEGRMQALGDGLLFQKALKNLGKWREDEDEFAQTLQQRLDRGEALVSSERRPKSHQD